MRLPCFAGGSTPMSRARAFMRASAGGAKRHWNRLVADLPWGARPAAASHRPAYRRSPARGAHRRRFSWALFLGPDPAAGAWRWRAPAIDRRALRRGNYCTCSRGALLMSGPTSVHGRRRRGLGARFFCEWAIRHRPFTCAGGGCGSAESPASGWWRKSAPRGNGCRRFRTGVGFVLPKRFHP